MRPFTRSTFLALAMLPVLLMAGCGGPSVEKNPAFMKLSKQVDSNTNEVKDISRQLALLDSRVETMNKDFQQVSTDVGAMMAKGGGSPEANKALEQKVQALEANLERVTEELAALRKQRGSEEARPARRGEQPAEEAVAPAGEGQKAQPARRTTPAQRTTHMIKQGETIEDIAKIYGVSADQIRAANRIPAGRNVAPNQKIIIPR